jgi:uncharacterized membrane protein HdeD (DUF308 family)
MDSDISQARAAGRALVERGAARWWRAVLAAGLIWFLIGWLVLRASYTSLATVGVLVGGVLLVTAVTEGAMAAVVTGGWKVAHVALAVFFLLGAIWAFARPINTFFALASVLGLLLFVQGFLYVVQGVALRDASPYWWIELVSGGLIVLLALWISTSDRVWTLAARSAFILLWVGFMAVFRGIRDIVLAFELRRLGRRAELEPQGEDEADAAAAFVPPQERRTTADAPRERQP